MDPRLSELIRDCSSSNGVSSKNATDSGVTFCNLGSKNRFGISYERLADLLDGYCSLAFEDENSEELLSPDDEITNSHRPRLALAEVASRNTIPIIANMIFSFHRDSDRVPQLYTERFLMTLVYCYQSVIKELLILNESMGELFCCVQESQPWITGDTNGSYINVQIRLQFPYCNVNTNFQRSIFRPRIEQVLRQKNVIGMLEQQPIGDWKTIIEEISDVVPMYRSVDHPNKMPMTLTHIYGFFSENDIEEYRDVNDSLDKFSPNSHSYFFQNKISTCFLNKDVDLEYWIPLILSINFWPSECRPQKVNQPASSLFPAESSAKESVFEEEITSEDNPLYLLNELLPMLNLDRAITEPFWLDVGRVIYNITGGTDEGLKIWTSFSARANLTERNKESCIRKYYTLRNTPLTIKTVAWYARQDSPAAYADWHRAWCDRKLNDALNLTHGDVAEAIYRVFWLDFMCGGAKKNKWYHFSNHILKPLDDAVTLRRFIDTRFIPIYEKIRAELAAKISTDGTRDAVDKKSAETHLEMITNLIKRIKNQGFRNSVIQYCREKFFVENFEALIDRDDMKMGWTNCVTEICNGKAYKRPGKPEDFITMSTWIPLRGDLHWEHELVKKLMKWLNQCFTDPELLRYFMKDAASMLKGKNSEKLFRTWVGEGDNSKSMLVKLFQSTLGQYCVDFPAALLSGESRNASGPTPELAQARGTHLGFVCEPNDNILRGENLKRYTGGDRFFARMLNENGGPIEAFFNLILMCNRIPNIPNVDKAVVNRFVIIPFLSTWTSDAPDDEEEQFRQRRFKVDRFFENQIPDLAYAFAWVLVEMYPTYAQEGLKAPQIVREYTDKHWEENDPYRTFIMEKIQYAYTDKDGVPTPDVNKSLTASEIFPHYRSWFKEYYPNCAIPDAASFRTAMMMQGRLGPQGKGRKWLGIEMASAVTQLASAE